MRGKDRPGPVAAHAELHHDGDGEGQQGSLEHCTQEIRHRGPQQDGLEGAARSTSSWRGGGGGGVQLEEVVAQHGGHDEAGEDYLVRQCLAVFLTLMAQNKIMALTS